MDRADALYQQGRQAFDQRAWSAAISYSARALTVNPVHAGALNLIVAARQQLDLAVDPEGERRVLSVLMADLVGSTRLPGLLGPEGYREVLLALHDISVTAITAYEGRVAQYLGDGILAYFSYPEAHEDDAERAVLAGLDIVHGLAARRSEFDGRFGADIRVRVGIDTGLVVIGALGAGRWTTSDSIVGDPPNVASRIQHLARPNTVVVSEATGRLVERRIALHAGRPRQVRGFPAPVVLYRAIGPIAVAQTATSQPGIRPLVGRDAETAVLGRAWADVLAGGHRCVRLVGEAGIGKSRLVEHMVNLAHAAGGRSVVLNCTALRRHVPFHPIAAALQQLFGFRGSHAPTEETLLSRFRELIPLDIDRESGLAVVASILGVGRPTDLLPEQLRERTLSLLTDAVRMTCAQGPLLLVVEDIHDADPSSVELLRRVVNQDSAPLALLITSRPDGPDLTGDITTVVLDALDEVSAAAVVRQVLSDAAPEQVDTLVGRADGVPLYLEELARWALEQQGQHAALPVALSGVLSARLDGLPGGARELASTAAVIGTQIDHELLSAISGLPEERLEQHLRSLLSRHILLRTSSALETGYRFRHTLLREAAYNRQVRDIRRAVHRRCAEVLTGRGGRAGIEAPAVIATHYEEGAEPAQALHWWSEAAGEAAGKGANLEAIDEYGRALRLVDAAVPEGAARSLTELGLRLGLGVSSSAAAGYSSPMTLEAFERADEIGGSLPASPEWAAAVWGLWSFFIVRGELDRAEHQVARARLMSEELSDQQLASTTSAMAGYVLFFQGRLEEAVEELHRGLDSHATLLPNDPRTVSMALIGVIQWLQGDLESSERMMAEAFAEARALPGGRGAFTLAFISAYWAWLAQLAGDATAAVQRAQETVDLASEHHFLTWQAAGYIHLTAGLCDLGMLEAGISGLEETIEAWKKAGAGLMVPYFLGQLASAKLAAGSVDVAQRVIDEALRASETNGEHVYDAELFRLRARIGAAIGWPAGDVVRDLERSVRVALAQGARVFALRSLIDLFEHDVSEVPVASSSVDIHVAVGWWEGRSGPPELARAEELLVNR